MHLSAFQILPGKTLVALLLGLTLTACGGSGSDSWLDPEEGPGDENGNGNGNGNGGGAETAQLGHGSGANFVAGEIETSIPEGSTLSAGGSTSLSVTLVNEEEDLITEPTTISFNSACLSSGAASLSNTDDESDTNITTTTGRASVTFHAAGCVGEDEIVAIAESEAHDNINVARATLFVDQDTLDQIQFIDTAPSTIGVRGMGAETTTSEVRFRVVGENGSPMQDVPVDFSLINPPAGATLSTDSDTSNPDGYVSTRVRAGTGAGVVSVTATANGSSTESRRLVITTTTPTQRHASLSIADPILTAWRMDGIETQVTMRLGDQNNNHIPEGTAVYFTTSAGVIDGECFTGEDSACSVTWRSQGERPRGSGGFTFDLQATGDEGDPYVGCPGDEECRGGRVVVFATTKGNESFIDVDNNGVYDPGTDLFATEGNCEASVPLSYIPPAPIEEACDDLGPAYLDTNFNGRLDDDERVLDPQESNGIYNGILCRQEDHDAGLCSRDPVTIRKSNMIVMASDTPYTPIPGLPGAVSIGLDETKLIRLIIADQNGNGMPSGTALAVNDNLAHNVDFTLSTDTVGGSSEPTRVTLQLESDDEDDAYGEFGFSVEYEGTTTTVDSIQIN